MKTEDAGLDANEFPSEDAVVIASLNAALGNVLKSIPVQQTVSVGTRWDVAARLALKVQWDHGKLGRNSPGTLVNRAPNFEPGGRFNVWSVSADIVF
jgi:hypothetical protein